MGYDPTLGRFISRDPIGYADGMNPYQAVRSNPIRFRDPQGLFPLTEEKIDAANRMDEVARQLCEQMLNKWAAKQKKRLGSAFSSLCPTKGFKSKDGQCCSPENCKAQAQSLADAMVDELLAYRWNRETDQLGGWRGNWMGQNQCGDWQQMMMDAADKAIGAAKKDGNACFLATAVDAKGPGGGGLWTSYHSWVEINLRDQTGGTVNIDPWPNGGKGNMDDGTNTGGWPTVTRYPLW